MISDALTTQERGEKNKFRREIQKMHFQIYLSPLFALKDRNLNRSTFGNI
jgi:hypothetical protein